MAVAGRAPVLPAVPRRGRAGPRSTGYHSAHTACLATSSRAPDGTDHHRWRPQWRGRYLLGVHYACAWGGRWPRMAGRRPRDHWPAADLVMLILNRDYYKLATGDTSPSEQVVDTHAGQHSRVLAPSWHGSPPREYRPAVHGRLSGQIFNFCRGESPGPPARPPAFRPPARPPSGRSH
eukprot:gene23149-biopygen10321